MSTLKLRIIYMYKTRDNEKQRQSLLCYTNKSNSDKGSLETLVCKHYQLLLASIESFARLKESPSKSVVCLLSLFSRVNLHCYTAIEICILFYLQQLLYVS